MKNVSVLVYESNWLFNGFTFNNFSSFYLIRGWKKKKNQNENLPTAKNQTTSKINIGLPNKNNRKREITAKIYYELKN